MFQFTRPTWNGSYRTRITRQGTSTIRQLDRERAYRGGSRLPSGSRAIDCRCRRSSRYGTSQCETELIKHISRHDRALMEKMVGVETVDHPSDRQLVAHARHYFKAEDRMLPQKG